jgi:hypothetical protein
MARRGRVIKRDGGSLVLEDGIHSAGSAFFNNTFLQFLFHFILSPGGE